MSNGGPTTETRNVLGALLRRLGISKVVCVDDEHASALTLEDILGWLESASPEDIASTFPDFEGRTQPERDIRAIKFRQWWESLESAQREQRASTARSSIQEEARADSPDVDYMSVLSELFDGMEEIAFIALGPKEWADQGDELLSASDCGHTLFLFDQDMSKGDGRKNEGSLIVGSVLAQYNDPRPLCGILTHTTTTDGQVARWEELASEAGIERDQFMVIPKGLLTDNLQEFTRQMKFAVLAPSFRELKEVSSNILSESLVKAKQELDDLTVLDFDHMVMRVAHGEGIWEGQVLFRLHAHFHRLEAEQQARNNTDLSSLISQIRKVSDIPELGRSIASDVVREIMHAELYEQGSNINNAHLDIATGDVFEATTVDGQPPTRWLLATQACDLAMRSNGERNVKQALLLRIVEFSKNKWEKEAKKQPRYLELDYFDKEAGASKKAVDFVSTSFAPCWMLDTCVLNDSGECGIHLDAGMPEGLLPGWVVRFYQVVAKAKELHDRCDLSCVVDETTRRGLLKRLAPIVTSCGTVRVCVAGGHVQIPLQRIKRLRIAPAMEMVRQFAAYMARTPHEVDLARKA